MKRFNIPKQASAKDAYGWIVMGRVLAIIVAFLFWMSSDRSAYEVLSALILAWSLLVSWNQMVAFSKGRMASGWHDFDFNCDIYLHHHT